MSDSGLTDRAESARQGRGAGKLDDKLSNYSINEQRPESSFVDVSQFEKPGDHDFDEKSSSSIGEKPLEEGASAEGSKKSKTSDL